MLDLKEVALGILLHGAEVLLRQSTAGTRTGFSEALLEELGYPESVREAILGLRSGETGSSEIRCPSTLVVREAERVAGGEEPGSDTAAPLNSVFSFVRLRRPAPEQPRSYRPLEYGGAGVEQYLPAEDGVGAGAEAHRALKDGLVRSLEEMEDPADVIAVMNLLERYGSYVRADIQAESGDVSLFDHSRTTAAIAVCIAGHLNAAGVEVTLEEVEREDAERYLFVRGDISGVQKFIYTITSRGALRMLRARSFFLELLAEHAVATILRRSGVPRTNVILVGGGGFQLLLPNTECSMEAVDEARTNINAALEGFGRTLSLELASRPRDVRGLMGDGLREVLREVGEELSEAKAGKFRERFGELFSRQFEPGLETCDVCTRDDAPVGRYDTRGYDPLSPGDEEKEISLCATCHMLGKASLKLVRSKYLTRGTDFRIGETGYGLSENGRGAVYALDGVGDERCLRGAVPLPAARYALPDEEQINQIMDFDDISRKAAGISRLAVLRMDVDNLGEVFRSGLPENMRIFSRYASLSRSFTTFFKMVLPRICDGGYDKSLQLFTKNRARAATVVYSGGDDLFIVGAWSDVLELAVDVRRAFREFVCENLSITLSAGISLHKSGEPLYLMAEAAGAAEETAKKNKENGREKDSAVLFHRGAEVRRLEEPVPEALFWDEVEEVVRLLEQINEFREPNKKLPFPRGFTRLLIDVVEVYEQEGHLSLPRLAYALARMEEGGKLEKDPRWQQLEKKLLDIETVKKHLRPAAYWLDLAEREKGDADG